MAWLSLGVAGCAAIVVVIIWVTWREEAPPVPRQRVLSDVTLEWMCVQDQAHRFKAPGRVEPRTCEVCGATAYIVLPYECQVHGEFEALIQFRREESPGAGSEADSREVPDKFSYDGRTWYPFETWVRCPHDGCDQPTERVRHIWQNKSKKPRKK